MVKSIGRLNSLLWIINQAMNLHFGGAQSFRTVMTKGVAVIPSNCALYAEDVVYTPLVVSFHEMVLSEPGHKGGVGQHFPKSGESRCHRGCQSWISNSCFVLLYWPCNLSCMKAQNPWAWCPSASSHDAMEIPENCLTTIPNTHFRGGRRQRPDHHHHTETSAQSRAWKDLTTEIKANGDEG